MANRPVAVTEFLNALHIAEGTNAVEDDGDEVDTMATAVGLFPER